MLKDVFNKGTSKALLNLNKEYNTGYDEYNKDKDAQQFAKTISEATETHMNTLDSEMKLQVISAKKWATVHAQGHIRQSLGLKMSDPSFPTSIEKLASTLATIQTRNDLLCKFTLTMCVECHQLMTDIPGIPYVDIVAELNKITVPRKAPFETVYNVARIRSDKASDVVTEVISGVPTTHENILDHYTLLEAIATDLKSSMEAWVKLMSRNRSDPSAFSYKEIMQQMHQKINEK